MKKLLERFMRKNCKRQVKNKQDGKVFKRKGNKLYVKWKGYDNSLNSWFVAKRLFLRQMDTLMETKALNQIYLIIKQKQT